MRFRFQLLFLVIIGIGFVLLQELSIKKKKKTSSWNYLLQGKKSYCHDIQIYFIRKFYPARNLNPQPPWPLLRNTADTQYIVVEFSLKNFPRRL